MAIFKAGDKVYAPEYSTKILILESTGEKLYPNVIKGSFYKLYTLTGKCVPNSESPSIFHATPENHEKLEQLYGVEFEKPKPIPSDRDIVKSLLSKQRFALCFVGDHSWEATMQHRTVKLVVDVNDDGVYEFITDDDYEYKYAIPINHMGIPLTEIEPPKTKSKQTLTSQGIIKHLLNKQKFVVCYVSDFNEKPDYTDGFYIVTGFDEDNHTYTTTVGNSWKYATPIDLNGNPITEIDDE